MIEIVKSEGKQCGKRYTDQTRVAQGKLKKVVCKANDLNFSENLGSQLYMNTVASVKFGQTPKRTKDTTHLMLSKIKSNYIIRGMQYVAISVINNVRS